MHYFNKSELRILEDVLSLPTTSFHEQFIQEYVLHFIKKLGLDIKTDVFGNILVHYEKGNTEKPIVFTAHMDHPGFSIIERIAGFDYVGQFYGGTNKDFFPGAKLLIYSDSKYIEAQAVSPLFEYREDLNKYDPQSQENSEKSEAEQRKNISEVDSKDAREKLLLPQFRIETRDEVNVNDMGFFDVTFFNIKGDLLYTKDADDLVNVAALLILLQRTVKLNSDSNFYVLFTRAEETGFTGCQGAIESKILPENSIPIVLETSAELEQAKIGQGFILRVGDRFSTYNTLVDSWMHEVAADISKELMENPDKKKTAASAKAKNEFKFQRTLMDGGTCEASLFNVSGFDTGALAIALGNYHNIGKSHPAPEYISLFDLCCLVEFMQKLVITPFSTKRSKYLVQRIADRFTKLAKFLEDNPYSSMSTDI